MITKKAKKKTQKEAIKVLCDRGEAIESNQHCEDLIQTEIREELEELLNDRENYKW